MYYLGDVKWWIERKAVNSKFLNDYDGIGKISLKPEQSSKRNPRRLALLNSSLMLGKEGIKLTPQGVGRNTRLLLVFVLVYVQVRHQVDLLDLGKYGRVKFQIKEFFFDIFGFSRFIWLRPLESKNSRACSCGWVKGYIRRKWTPLLVLQSDQGSELKVAVERLGRKLRIKMVYSRSYHSQSQGKLEVIVLYYVRALHVPRWSMIL